MKITTSADLPVGSRITIAGVYLPSPPRSRWQRFVDWILRRPTPPRILQEFRVVECIVSRSPNEFRIDTLFGDGV